MSIFRSAKLAEEESKRLIAMYDASCVQLAKQRIEFENLVAKSLKTKYDEFNRIFEYIDDSMFRQDYATAAVAVTNLSGLLGKTLNYSSFEEFDAFMLNPNTILSL